MWIRSWWETRQIWTRVKEYTSDTQSRVYSCCLQPVAKLTSVSALYLWEAYLGFKPGTWFHPFPAEMSLCLGVSSCRWAVLNIWTVLMHTLKQPICLAFWNEVFYIAFRRKTWFINSSTNYDYYIIIVPSVELLYSCHIRFVYAWDPCIGHCTWYL
jgi:hypothetical protein